MTKTFCQSCSMPMVDAHILGTEKDGSKNSEYCLYCYEEGAFKQPDITMEQMIEICVPFLKEEGMEENAARAMLQKHLPELARWKTVS